MTRILHTINYDENKYDDAYDIFIAYDENNELPFRKYKSGGLGRINAKKGIPYICILVNQLEK
ncbi:hypothetical protein DFH79_001378 [Clostridium beijerinckii]|uniref:hypothetical protein n=1 Tax=Clostridium beijerinckii TaxID=1520 RepID=UPI001570146D|nr:hypothetical protein [Clostridium beijerinckii]NRW93125.1 hypothetical protein [Clostridium beijerinckii]